VSIIDAARYAFSLYAVPTALTSALMLVFGASLLLRRASRLTIVFFALTASVSLWLCAFTFMYCAVDANVALFWARMAYIGVPLIAPSIYHFAVEMLHIGRTRRTHALLGWMLGAVFATLAVPTSLLVTRVDRFWWGFYPRYGGELTIPFLVFFFGYLVAALGEFIIAYPGSRGVERQRIRMMIAAFAIAYLGCVDYLPKFGMPIYPIGYLPVMAFVAIAAYTFRRYDIVAITPSLAAREIIGTMADALFVCDRGGVIHLTNAAAERLLGYGANELIGRRLEDLLLSGDDTFSTTLRRRSVRTEEHVFQAKNGQRVELTISIAPVVDDGEPAGAIMIGRDMRERKEAERQIRRALTLLESTLECTADGILVVGAGGRVLTFNQRFVDMWRIPPQVMAMTNDRVITSFIVGQLSDPDDYLRTIETLYAQAEAESFDLLEFKDGRRFERYSIGRAVEGVAAMRVWSFRDVTARFAAESALRESELRYRLLFEQNAAGVCVTTVEGMIVDCNSTFAAMLGYNRVDLLAQQMGEIYARPTERDELAAMLSDVATLNSVEVELRRRDGSSVWVLKNLTLSGDRIHSTVVDISDRKRAEEQIEFHAYHDVLTNLPNRKLFMDRLSQALTRCRRYGKSLAVMFIDLDHFKTINDTLGHNAGDQLLLEMSLRLRGCIRDDDTVARLGGDEFTIILSELRHPEDAANVAEKILESVEQPLTIADTPIEVSASIGIALYPVDGHDAEALLRNADSAMYRAKEAGRNTYQLCTDEMKRRAVERLSLESRLRRAVHDGELLLHYQPQISLVTGKVIAVEALVRWNDPERGIVHPSSFIPLAEESRLIVPLGEWVLRTACEQMRAWRDAGVEVASVAVNLSPRQFQQHDLVSLVRRTLEQTGLDGSALEIEITESTAMQNAEVSLEVLHALRGIGVGISLDDFGTGYSSLNYLKRFPITCVKIDRLFIRDVETSDGDAAIVSAVIGISRNLHLRVVAEGVETTEQAVFLRRRKCDAAQGYLFSRPVSAERIPEIIEQHPEHRRRSGPWLHA
jgi:diguanylate cyclase (GGDEF)-like protein/PAS domain S-box-containing protein